MNANIKDKRKSEIMNIASDLFYSKGIADTTISEITYLAKIGKGTFYEYFRNKDDVINEYIKQYFQIAHMEILEKIDEYKTNEEKILFIIKYLYMSKASDKKFTYILIEFLRLTFNKKKEESEELHHFNEQNIELISQYIQKGIEQKEFKKCDTKEIAFELNSTILGNLVLSLSYEFKDCDKSTRYNVRTILDSIKYEG